MRLVPYSSVDDVAFDMRPAQLRRLRGSPLRRRRNDVGLIEFDYGDEVYRFQDCGRLEEVTKRVRVLQLAELAVPFAHLEGFVRANDRDAFGRAGFVISPRFGVAFVPDASRWVTALAAHGVDAWRALDDGAEHTLRGPR